MMPYGPYYMLGCPAEVEVGGEFFDVSLIGLYGVEEFHPYEPSNYVHTPTYGVSALEYGLSPMYYVDADEFLKQTHPAAYARGLVRERELALAEERDFS